MWVTRFDRANGQRFALEDATQVIGILPSQKYSVPAEEVVTALATKCAAVPLAQRNLYLQFLIAWLTGNGDLHAKNVSILKQEGRWDVAPIHDLLCTALYRVFTLALPLNAKTKNLKRQDWLDFAASIGLPKTVAESSKRQVLTVVARINLSQLPVSGSTLTGAERELRHRRYQIEA
ncbi:HipA domain-containing protein [Corynebacterium sp. H130]|uniref:HipA domain-containing protein n=1 Tax=Corynebacterium sp. H130 TaxID=3133444 RepID=UPI0030AD6E0B